MDLAGRVADAALDYAIAASVDYIGNSIMSADGGGSRKRKNTVRGIAAKYAKRGTGTMYDHLNNVGIGRIPRVEVGADVKHIRSVVLRPIRYKPTKRDIVENYLFPWATVRHSASQSIESAASTFTQSVSAFGFLSDDMTWQVLQQCAKNAVGVKDIGSHTNTGTTNLDGEFFGGNLAIPGVPGSSATTGQSEHTGMIYDHTYTFEGFNRNDASCYVEAVIYTPKFRASKALGDATWTTNCQYSLALADQLAQTKYMLRTDRANYGIIDNQTPNLMLPGTATELDPSDLTFLGVRPYMSPTWKRMFNYTVRKFKVDPGQRFMFSVVTPRNRVKYAEVNNMWIPNKDFVVMFFMHGEPCVGVNYVSGTTSWTADANKYGYGPVSMMIKSNRTFHVRFKPAPSIKPYQITAESNMDITLNTANSLFGDGVRPVIRSSIKDEWVVPVAAGEEQVNPGGGGAANAGIGFQT